MALGGLNTGPSGVRSTKSLAAVRNFLPLACTVADQDFRIAGATKDSTGVALAAATVVLFYTATNTVQQSTISDASGAYSFFVDGSLYYAVAYKSGGTDVAGTTKNTLTGS